MLPHFHFFISRFRERNFLRVCGAEVEWTLQKCGGGLEFAIKTELIIHFPHPFLH
jgi:hypothetical protein